MLLVYGTTVKRVSITHTLLLCMNIQMTYFPFFFFILCFTETFIGVSYSTSLVRDDTVSLGSLIAQSGDDALIGKSLHDGIFLYLNHYKARKKPLATSYTVSLDVRDYRDKIVEGMSEIEPLLSKTNTFFAPFSEHFLVHGFVPLMKKHSLVSLLFPVSGKRKLEGIEINERVVWFRPSYAQELRALITHAVTVLQKKKIGVFYEESSWGREALASLEQFVKRFPHVSLSTSWYQSNTINISSAVKAFQKSQPDIIICISDPRPAYSLIKEAINNKLHYVTFMGISRLAGIQENVEKSRGIRLITSSVVPNPFTSQLPIVKAYRKDMAQFLSNKSLSVYSLEGYIVARLLIHYLDQIVAKQGSWNDLYTLICTQRLSFGGLSLEYYNHTLSHTVWINDGMKNSKWKQYKEVKHAAHQAVIKRHTN